LVEVQVFDETDDVKEEPAKVTPQQSKPQEIAATKKSLRLQEQNTLATAKKKQSWRRIRSLDLKKRELDQVKIALEENK
jgi:hypothetical protein